jgi:hypothetical protein
MKLEISQGYTTMHGKPIIKVTTLCLPIPNSDAKKFSCRCFEQNSVIIFETKTKLFINVFCFVLFQYWDPG